MTRAQVIEGLEHLAHYAGTLRVPADEAQATVRAAIALLASPPVVAAEIEQVRAALAQLRAEVDDVLATALVHDDKPHLLFSAIRKLASAEAAGARRDEIVQLMDSAYEAARQVDESEG
jgi:hypothetical protein